MRLLWPRRSPMLNGATISDFARTGAEGQGTKSPRHASPERNSNCGDRDAGRTERQSVGPSFAAGVARSRAVRERAIPCDGGGDPGADGGSKGEPLDVVRLSPASRAGILQHGAPL